jgi:hypothetical protein
VKNEDDVVGYEFNPFGITNCPTYKGIGVQIASQAFVFQSGNEDVGEFHHRCRDRPHAYRD